MLEGELYARQWGGVVVRGLVVLGGNDGSTHLGPERGWSRGTLSSYHRWSQASADRTS